MTKKQILEGNIIIAEFMNEKLDPSKIISDKTEGKNLWVNLIKMELGTEIPTYDKSWDWLLPAYKKLGTELKKLSSDIKSYKRCSWVSKQATLAHIDNCDAVIRCEIWGVRILDAFNGIAETIKWYNKNKDFKKCLKDK